MHLWNVPEILHAFHRWHACGISSYWLASVSLQDKRGILYSTQSHRSACRSATTSRMSWLSDTTPPTEHINCSTCCSSSLHEEAWPTDPTILHHTPALGVRPDIHPRVTGTLHYPPPPLRPDSSPPTSWHQIALCFSNEFYHSKLLAR